MSESNENRAELERRIVERLTKLDEDSLLRLDAISEYAEQRARPVPLPIGGATEAVAFEQGVTRRKFLLGAGGAVLAGTAIVSGVVGSALSGSDMLKQRALLALYEELEKVGLDSVVSAAVAAIGAALELAKTLGGALSGGIKLVDGALLGFERLFPLVRQGLALVEGAVSALVKLVRTIEQMLADVTGIAKPVTASVAKFFSDLLDKIPFGVGTNVKTLINNLIVLVGTVPTFIENLNTNLITPLKQDWFTDDEKKGLKGSLFEPLRKNVAPINQALVQRAAIRKQIADVQAGKQVQGTVVP
ncbi:MAG: hypothetical protein LC737_02310 [Chloroflexi bacterium]|nr:hypothetical protein [Chloroflexota bacterium]